MIKFITIILNSNFLVSQELNTENITISDPELKLELEKINKDSKTKHKLIIDSYNEKIKEYTKQRDNEIALLKKEQSKKINILVEKQNKRNNELKKKPKKLKKKPEKNKQNIRKEKPTLTRKVEPITVKKNKKKDKK